MIDLLLTIAAFLVALSLLIAVHEYGHFWVARKMGVKVLRFSIGFGRVLWRQRSRDGETEYVIAALPLGGYVKMLDEREGEVEAHELPRAFNRQGVARRFAIVAAGPVFNFLFAIVAYWLMFVIGVTGVRPLLGEVPVETPAYHAGLQSGQQIMAVDEVQTPTWGSVLDALLPKLLLKEPVVLHVSDGEREFQRTLRLDALEEDIPPEQVFKRTGLQPFRPPIRPVIDEVVDGSAAQAAGLRAGDEIVSVEDQAVAQWRDLVAIIQSSPGKSLRFGVMRGQQFRQIVVIPERVESKAGVVGKIGASVKLDPVLFEKYRSELRYGPVQAFTAAVGKTGEMSLLTLRLMWEMLVGRASVENISGPITIAQFAKSSALAGVSQFLGFLAIVSLSLGVLNLLPIPVLDGGHLMFYVYELLRGRPVSERAEEIGQRIGLTLIFALMMIAFYNDIARLSG